MKKPRSDAKLKTLPEDRQLEIAKRLQTESLDEVRAWLRADGLEVSSTALSQFLSWFTLKQQMSKNESTVETLLANLQTTRPDWTPEQVQKAGQAFFSALALEQQDAKVWYLSQRLALKHQENALNERKLVILEKKAAAFDRAQEILENAKTSKGGITPETLTKIERELKLL